MAIASAPRKVILFGEHSIVYPGHIGVAAAIDNDEMRTHARVSTLLYGSEVHYNFSREYSARRSLDEFKPILDEFNHILKKKDWDALSKKAWHPVDIILAEIFNTYGKPVALDVRTESDVRNICHVGSGTAAFASVAMATLQELKIKANKDLVSKLAFLGDIIAHGGRPSGIDNAVITYGGFLKYEKFDKGGKYTPLKIANELEILLWRSNELSKTKDMVQKVAKNLERNPKLKEEMDKINGIAEDGIKYLNRGDLQAVGKLMSANHKILRKLGASTKTIDSVVTFLENMGVYGAKLTGAGGGGCVIAIGEREVYRKILGVIPYYPVRLGTEGVRLEKSF